MFLQEHKPTMWGSITQKISWLLKLKTLTFSYGILFRMLGGLNRPKLSASYKILFLNLSDPVLRLCLWTSSVRNRNISNFWDIKTYPNSCFSTDTTQWFLVTNVPQKIKQKSSSSYRQCVSVIRCTLHSSRDLEVKLSSTYCLVSSCYWISTWSECKYVCAQCETEETVVVFI